VNRPETAILTNGPTTATFGMPNELLPLLGRSLTQRAVETIVGAGIRDIHVILGEDPRAMRLLLGDGTRWGCRIHYHHALPGEPVSALVHRLGLPMDRYQILADTTRLPIGITEQLAAPVGGAGEVWVHSSAGVRGWSGWGRVRTGWLAGCDLPLASTALADHMLGDPAISRKDVAQTLSAATPRDILHATSELLAGPVPRVIIGRGSRVDPTAHLIAPVWIGRNVRIGRNTRVGPGVTIGDGALIEAGSILSNAMILSDTFVGDGLTVEDTIIGGSRLASVRLGTVIDITDTHLLSHAARGSRIGSVDWRERALAAALRLVLSPLRLAAGGRRLVPGLRIPLAGDSGPHGPTVTLSMADPTTACSTEGSCDALRHFRECFFPGLGDVVAGRLRLLGPTPRSREALAVLPEPWRLLYTDGRPGLLQEGLLASGETDCSDLPMASDAIAAATRDDPRARRHLLGRYLGRVLRCLLGRWTGARFSDYANGRSGTQRRIA